MTKDTWTKEQRKDYNKKYYQDNMEKRKKEGKSRYRLKKMGKSYSKNLKLRKIEVTTEELAIAKKAANFYAMSSPFYITPEEVLGDAYICLLMAIDEYDPERYENRKTFLSQRIAQRLIDAYRTEFGRNKSNKRKYLTTITSLNTKISFKANDDNADEMIGMLEANVLDSGTKMDSTFFREKVKNEMSKISFAHRNRLSMYKMWYSYYITNETMLTIADKYEISQSRVSQIFKHEITPCFNRLKKQLQRQYPEFCE